MPAMSRRTLTIPRFERIPRIVHGFGTAAWNEDDFATSGDLGSFRTILLDQIHSDAVHTIEAPSPTRPAGDALITREAGLLLVIKTADCLPVLIADGKQRVVAAVHCGWRGTRLGILRKVLDALRSNEGSDPRALLVAMGPCIGPECYEVGIDVIDEFNRSGFPSRTFKPSPGHPGKYLLDLREANRFLLIERGVREKNIFSLNSCTHCRPELLSYRRDRDKTRRMFAFIGMKGI